MTQLTRRDWLRSLIRPKPPAPAPLTLDQNAHPPPATLPAAPSPTSNLAPQTASVAIIAGRYCLAYQGSFCTTCSEHCPEPGAIVIESGLPRVVAEVCTGCRKCHEACPAPEENAIRILPRRPSPAQP